MYSVCLSGQLKQALEPLIRSKFTMLTTTAVGGVVLEGRGLGEGEHLVEREGVVLGEGHD
jgi:hypothetical protein